VALLALNQEAAFWKGAEQRGVKGRVKGGQTKQKKWKNYWRA
jgi:hypothetical protein